MALINQLDTNEPSLYHSANTTIALQGELLSPKFILSTAPILHNTAHVAYYNIGDRKKNSFPISFFFFPPNHYH